MNIIARAHNAAGTLPAAVVLIRIAFWISVNKKKHRDWTAMSNARLCEETGCTPKQVKVALTTLRLRKLITSEQHLFNSKNINHFRLTDRARTILKGCEADLKEMAKETPKDCHPQSPKGPLYKQGVSSGSINIKKEKTGETSLTSTNQTVKVKGSPGENEMGKPTVTELLTRSSLNKPPAKSPKSGTVGELTAIWKKSLVEQKGPYFPGFTMKTQGQLKQFMTKCQGSGMSGAQVLTACLAEWGGFTAQVKTAAGLSAAPLDPHVGFLLVHVGHAVSFAKPPLKGVKPVKAGIHPTQPSNPPAASVEPSGEQPATAEELEAILGISLTPPAKGKTSC